MQYIHCFEVPFGMIEPSSLRWGLLYPILDGDASLPRKLGDPLDIENLIPSIEPGDRIAGDRDFISWIMATYPSPSWVPSSGYWSDEYYLDLEEPGEE